MLGTLQACRVRFPRLRSHTYNLRAPLCSTMSRLMLALGLGALAGASAFERAAPTFELRAATVPKVGSLAAAPGGPLCNICEQLADQALQQLINIILQVRSLRGLGATRTSREKPIAGEGRGSPGAGHRPPARLALEA